MTEPRQQTIWTTIGWWIVTLAILMVLDDLTFGPLFWAASRAFGQLAAVLAAFSIYVTAQILLVRQGTAETPGRIAGWFLGRLQLERKHPEVADREHALQRRVAGATTALLMTVVIGGVLPPLLLWRSGSDQRFVRRLSLLTAPIYAAEFAFLHGWLPGTI